MSLYNLAAWRIDRAAAGWFAKLEREPFAASEERAFAAWLARDPRHARAFARCHAAVMSVDKLRDRPSLRGAFDEAVALARSPAEARGPRPRPSSRHGRPALAWSVAALSTVVAVFAVVYRGPPAGSDAPAAGAAAPAATEADSGDEVAIGAAAGDPALVLPGDVVVDAGSVAVLPFGSTAPVASTPAGQARVEAVAARLYAGVLRQLATLPGVYVVDRRSAAAYFGREMQADEIARQLGARGIVEARVVSDGPRIRVELSFMDAATHTTVQKAFEGPADELAAMRSDIVTNIAGALADRPESSALPAPPADEGDLP